MLPNQGGIRGGHLSCEFTSAARGTVWILNKPPRTVRISDKAAGEMNWKSQDEAMAVSREEGGGGSHIAPEVPGIEGQVTCLVEVYL